MRLLSNRSSAEARRPLVSAGVRQLLRFAKLRTTSGKVTREACATFAEGGNVAAGYNPTQHELHRLIDAFREAKAEHDQVLAEPSTNAFVHTRAYRDSLDGARSLLIGRKGSGKTALLLGYKTEQETRYFAQGAIDIRADDFPLEALFSFFYTDSVRATKQLAALPHVSDLPSFVDPVKLSAYAWGQSLRCAAVYVVTERLLQDNSVKPDVRKRLLQARRSLNRYIGPKVDTRGASGSDVVFALLVYFFQNTQALIDNTLGIHTQEISVLLAAITRRLTTVFSGRLDKKIEEAARAIAIYMEGHDRRCLLTLDKFDDYYDEFYRQGQKRDSVLQRRDFLSSLLHGLVLAARDLRHDIRFRWVDALFAIPMDKFLELHIRERAELEQGHVLRLEWSPNELYEYVNRRIAYALNQQADEKLRPWERLFPFEVTNGSVKDVKENSFLYIVRHTLWRPREVQMYLRAIFQRMEEQRCAADEEMFRRLVKSEAEQIVRREFVEEFMSEYPGLPGLMKKLEELSLKSVMPYTEVCDRVAGVRLFDESMTAADVMLRLYHMGIVGVRQVLTRERRTGLDPSITQNREEVAYRFSYNSLINDPFSTAGTVVFHPMFFHYLDIRHDERYVVNQLTWQMFEES